MPISYTKLGHRVFPSTTTLNSQTPPPSQTTTPPPTARGCFWTARSSRPSLTRRRRSAGRRTFSHRSRAVSRWGPSLDAGRASPSSWPSTARASWWSSPARASRSWHRPEQGDDGRARSCQHPCNRPTTAKSRSRQAVIASLMSMSEG